MRILRQILFLGAFLAAVPAWSANEVEREKLSETINAALDSLYSEECVDASKEYKMARVRTVLEQYYDLNVIIRRTIGRNWRSFDSVQQAEVLELVKQLVVKAYVDGMDGLARPEVEFGEVITISEKRIEIASEVMMDGTPVSVIYRLGRLKSGWQIYDVVVEGISLVANFRQQIDDHFRQGNAAKLISKLKDLNQRETLNGTTKI